MSQFTLKNALRNSVGANFIKHKTTVIILKDTLLDLWHLYFNTSHHKTFIWDGNILVSARLCFKGKGIDFLCNTACTNELGISNTGSHLHSMANWKIQSCWVNKSQQLKSVTKRDFLECDNLGKVSCCFPASKEETFGSISQKAAKCFCFVLPTSASQNALAWHQCSPQEKNPQREAPWDTVSSQEQVQRPHKGKVNLASDQGLIPEICIYLGRFHPPSTSALSSGQFSLDPQMDTAVPGQTEWISPSPQSLFSHVAMFPEKTPFPFPLGLSIAPS